MPAGHRVSFIDPYRVAAPTGEQPAADFDLFERKCLAQGDSWFSIGSLPPGLTSNILAQLELMRSAAVVNCARPGKFLSHMTDTSSEPIFLRLFRGKLAIKWDAILFSGGGNDLIDAASVGPTAPPDQRLLATAAERGPGPLSGDQYISQLGWTTFETHLRSVFTPLVDLRDSGVNKHVPMVFHTYAHIMPRPAPVGFGHGPWLQPAMDAFGVPTTDWLSVSDALMDRLAKLFARLIAERQTVDPACELYLVESRPAPLILGDQTATGSSGDFLNEIHPTRAGYAKLADVWRTTLDPIFG